MTKPINILSDRESTKQLSEKEMSEMKELMNKELKEALVETITIIPEKVPQKIHLLHYRFGSGYHWVSINFFVERWGQNVEINKMLHGTEIISSVALSVLLKKTFKKLTKKMNQKNYWTVAEDFPSNIVFSLDKGHFLK